MPLTYGKILLTNRPINNLVQWFDANYVNNAAIIKNIVDNSTSTIQNMGGGTISLNSDNNNKNSYLYFDSGQNKIKGAYFYGANLYSTFNNVGWNQTQEVWINPTNLSNVFIRNAGVIINEQGSTSLDTNWFDSQLEINDGKIIIRVWSSSFLDLGTISGGWTHIVWKYQPGTLSGYVNGVKKGSISIYRSIPNGSYYSFIGAKCNTNLGNGNYYNGKLAVYRNYNTALTDSQILNNFNDEKNRFGLV